MVELPRGWDSSLDPTCLARTAATSSLIRVPLGPIEKDRSPRKNCFCRGPCPLLKPEEGLAKDMCPAEERKGAGPTLAGQELVSAALPGPNRTCRLAALRPRASGAYPHALWLQGREPGPEPTLSPQRLHPST